VVRTYGLIGTVRLQVHDHEVVESKKDGDKFDLRISNAFEELKVFCDNINMDELDSMEHSHVPFIVILYKAIEKWKTEVFLIF
jgi:amyloid beta precursor protein binding protein 1